jgi:DNA-binding transcriptional ArsR family regulator
MKIPMEEMAANASDASRMLKAIANESRLMIVCQLVDNEMSVGELLETIPLSQSALSQHLSVLRREKIVSTRRVAQSVIYSLASNEAHKIIETLYGIYCGSETK